MKPYQKLISSLEGIYSPQGDVSWVKRNSFIFTQAAVNDLAIAGSIAIAIARKKSIRQPGDIDFVCDSIERARSFIKAVEDKLLDYSCYYKVMTNHKTSFCPPSCSAHFRIITPFWMPICVMVIDPSMLRWWIHCGSYNVQDFNSVIDAAKALDERDNRGRGVELEGDKELSDIMSSEAESREKSERYADDIDEMDYDPVIDEGCFSRKQIDETSSGSVA